MKAIKILGFSIIFFILVCGCAGNSASEQKKQTISDDDLFLQSLNDFSSASSPAQQQLNVQFAQKQVIAAQLKNRSTTAYTRISPLNVSSKFEPSKTSILQALKEGEALADFYLNSSSDEQSTAAGKAQYTKAQTHRQNFLLSLVSTFDSDVCSAAGNTYTNVTAACSSFYDRQFFRYYQIL
jgi:hypothetical protein